jgi:hypothetical protein
MTRKLFIAGIAVIGFVLAVGSNSWADQKRGSHHDRGGGKYHQGWKGHPGHHKGWVKGRGNPHGRFYRHHPPPRHRHFYRHHYRRPPVRRHFHHYPRWYRSGCGRYPFSSSAYAFSFSIGGIH